MGYEEDRNARLIPLSERTPEERHRISVMGGKARAEQMKKRKAFKETIDILLSAKIKDKAVREQLKQLGFDSKSMDNQSLLIASAFLQATKGNVKAMEFIRNTAGEEASQKVEVSYGENVGDTMEKIINKLNDRKNELDEDEEEVTKNEQ
jgi:endonuclease III